MDVGWKTGGTKLCKALPLPHLMWERQVSFNCMLDHGRLACPTQCSISRTTTIGSLVPRSSFGHRLDRREQIWATNAGSTGQVGDEFVGGLTNVIENEVEFMEWRSRSEKVEIREDSLNDVAAQDYSSPVAAAELSSPRLNDGLDSPVESRLADGFVGQEDDSQELSRLADNKQQRGWRDLASAEDLRRQDVMRFNLTKKAWRRPKFAAQKFKNADSSSTGEVKAPLASKRDPNLENLFKTLATRQSDRSFAVERYFGREITEKVIESEKDTMDSQGKTLLDVPGLEIAGKVNKLDSQSDKPTKPKSPSGQERLKINLDLDLYRARCLKEEGRLDEAKALLSECIRDWQNDGRAFLAMGLLDSPYRPQQVNPSGEYPNLGNTDEGDSDELGAVPWSPAISEVGKRLEINLDLELYDAKCCKQRGRLDDSEAILRKCIRDWPVNGRPYVALGKLLLEQRKIEEARSLYEIGCQAVGGENPYIWQAWAILEEKCGDVTKARKYFDAAIVADKKHAAAWHGWANLEIREGNVNRAKSLLKKGLKLCGPNEYILQTLALLEYKEENTDQARLYLSKATRQNPKSAASWLAWALMESECGFIGTARRLFQKGLEASPKNRYVWQAWARFEAKQGRPERARELFRRGRELNPRDPVLLQGFALFEFQCGRPGIARDYFRKALTFDPTHQPVWIGWGWMEWKQGNISVARELYQGAIQANSRSLDAARAFQAWGVLEDREGDTSLARELFRCALKIDSQNAPTWMSWAAMEEREGRSVRADEIRNQFLQQRTEVVEGPWGVDISDLLAPAIDKIKGFFQVGRLSTWRGKGSGLKTDSFAEKNTDSKYVEVSGMGTPLDTSSSSDEEFDLDTFLVQTFPRKYGSGNLEKSTSSNFIHLSTLK